MRLSILALGQISHQRINDVRLRREQVQRIDIAVRRPSIENLLDVRNILIENGVLLEDIVNQAARVGVENEHFPVAAGNLTDGCEKDW